METKLADYSKTETPERKKVNITFLPQNIIVEGEEGKSILEIALEHEIELNHNCGGNCACTTCHVIIRNGMDNLHEAEMKKMIVLDKAVGLTLTSRLGCQAHVYGDVVVNTEK